ncbi:glycosyltransferase family 4 protein [Propionimicrobium sp. PCR01-08-3]|uniref:glycosyltransferase family 4 protein n=1 Tax=Propionimicrobium sp. PCR01-08-3 TaxID=3052086 RepID=UPI00255C3BFC|nr:glycosyltransferase family 4 protein [Propionimicrobium sp. PCR01-08-3]WIY84289.1 glycosyltransferase family 4 protein [Propionimicrobium sp. PCR01-08-3]
MKQASVNAAAKKHIIYGVTVGTSAYTLLKGQLRWLQSQGWSCSLATTPDSQAILAAKSEGAILCPLRMSRPVAPLSDVLALFHWLRLIWRVRPDAVNVSTPKAGLLGSIAAFLLRVPKRIYVMRGLRLEGSQGAMARLLWVMERITIACATDVIFVSPSLALAAADLGLSANDKGWVIGAGSSNGVDAARLEVSAIADAEFVTRECLGFSNSDFVVGFVGRIAPDKGIDMLIRVFQSPALPKNFKLLVVGATEDAELSARLSALGSRLHVTGRVNNVSGYMAKMDVLCLPTRREGFPNVVLEAGVMRIPVVATRATGTVDAVVDGETGLLVEIDDDGGLLRTLRAVADDPNRARTMGNNGYERAVRDFSPTRIWTGLLAILSNDYGSSDLHSTSRFVQKNSQKET